MKPKRREDRDIFGRKNSPLLRAGERFVEQAKEKIAKDKAYSKKEIDHAIKHDLCDRLESKHVSRTSMLGLDTSYKKKAPDPEAGILIACRASYAKFGPRSHHVECAEKYEDAFGKTHFCKCPCHKSAVSK